MSYKKLDIEVGDIVEGEGIYLGEWCPLNESGRVIGNKTFDLFTASEDLKDRFGDTLQVTFNNALKHVNKLKDYQGYDGGYFANQRALTESFQGNDYNGEWFIPSYDILERYMHKNKNKGSLKGSFNTVVNPERNKSLYNYWSCDVDKEGSLFKALYKSFAGAGFGKSLTSVGRMSVRVVRAKEQIIIKEDLDKKFRKDLRLKKPVRVRLVKFS